MWFLLVSIESTKKENDRDKGREEKEGEEEEERVHGKLIELWTIFDIQLFKNQFVICHTLVEMLFA